jgi:GntR family transcriptional repressor for pyruvate dehydrogenase complex
MKSEQKKNGLTTVRRTSIRSQVFEKLRDQIIQGVWSPGMKIPSENELTKLLGVSRISVRESLQKLVALGILETRHGEGTFVQPYSPAVHMNSLLPVLILGQKDLIEVLEYRKIMEVGAVEIAVERATDEDIRKLEEILRCMEADRDDERAFAADDLAFHLTIAEATGNEVIIRVNNIIKDILSVSMTKIVHNLGMQDGLRYHSLILDALKRRDKDEAKRAMEEHVLRTIDRIIAARKAAAG